MPAHVTHCQQPLESMMSACAREGAGALLRLRGHQADGWALLNHRGCPGLPQPGLPLRLCALRGGRR